MISLVVSAARGNIGAIQAGLENRHVLCIRVPIAQEVCVVTVVGADVAASGQTGLEMAKIRLVDVVVSVEIRLRPNADLPALRGRTGQVGRSNGNVDGLSDQRCIRDPAAQTAAGMSPGSCSG